MPWSSAEDAWATPCKDRPTRKDYKQGVEFIEVPLEESRPTDSMIPPHLPRSDPVQSRQASARYEEAPFMSIA